MKNNTILGDVFNTFKKSFKENDEIEELYDYDWLNE